MKPGFAREKRFRLMDRDAQFTMAFRTLLADAGIERFMRSIKSERLDRMIFFGEDSLRRAVREYVTRYHAEPVTRDSATRSSRRCPPLPGRSGAYAVVRRRLRPCARLSQHSRVVRRMDRAS